MSTRRTVPRHRAAPVSTARATRPPVGGAVAGLALGAVLVTAGTAVAAHDATALAAPAASATPAVTAPGSAAATAAGGAAEGAATAAGDPAVSPSVPVLGRPVVEEPAVEVAAGGVAAGGVAEEPALGEDADGGPAAEQPAPPPTTAVQRPPASGASATRAPSTGARTAADEGELRSLLDQLGALLGVELVVAPAEPDAVEATDPAEPVDPADPVTAPAEAAGSAGPTRTGQEAPAVPEAARIPAERALPTAVDRAAPVDAADEPFAGGRAFVDPDSDAAAAAAAATDPGQRAALQHLAAEGSATWVGDWSGDPATAVAEVVEQADAASQTPTFAIYNIPGRDCGSYSGGGAPSAEAYRTWIDGVASGLAGSGAVVVLEPDALAGLDCLPAEARGERLDLLADAAGRLDQAGATVYVDAGNPTWQPVDVMAQRLEAVGVDDVRGFALNVSAYQSTEANEAYGGALVDALGGGSHYVIDTSRNGSGPAVAGGEQSWCNPAGRSVGEGFTTGTGDEEVDALLWVKVPGHSDGACGGGPEAGQWWPERAVELAGAAS